MKRCIYVWLIFRSELTLQGNSRIEYLETRICQLIIDIIGYYTVLGALTLIIFFFVTYKYVKWFFL